MAVEYGVIGILIFIIAIMTLVLYRYSKEDTNASTLSLEKLKEEFDTSYFPMIESILKKNSSYKVAKALLLEIQKISEGKSLLEVEIADHKKAHTKVSEGLDKKTHEIIHISHQMRTSLSGLLGFTHFLQSTSLDEEQQEFVSIIALSSDELLTLVNNIIDMTPGPRDKKFVKLDTKKEMLAVPKNEIPCVLVVDDNEINKRLLSKVLENENLEVSYASNGEEAVVLRKEKNFDIIFMDIQMPVMDGVDASKAIRTYENKNNITPVPIVALTANTGKNDRDTYLDAGMTDYMAKPIMIEDVRKRISQL